MKDARQRMLLALGVSALLHAWFLYDVHGLRLNNVPRPVAAAPLTASLSAPRIDILASDIEPQAPLVQTSALALGKPGDGRADTRRGPVAPNTPEISAEKLI